MGLIGLVLLCNIVYQIHRQFLKNGKIVWIGAIGFIYSIIPIKGGEALNGSDGKYFTTLALVLLILSAFLDKQGRDVAVVTSSHDAKE